MLFVVLFEVFTHFGDATLATLRLAGQAGVSTMQYQPMVGNGEQLLRKALLELALGGQRGLGIA